MPKQFQFGNIVERAVVENGKPLVPNQFHSTNIVERFVVGNGKPLVPKRLRQLVFATTYRRKAA